MIPTKTTETAESWVCRACSSVNAGWRLRCERCGVLVRSSTSWGPPLPQPWPQFSPAAPNKRSGVKRAAAAVAYVVVGLVGLGAAGVGFLAFEDARERRQTAERVEDDVTGEVAQEFFAADSQFRATFPSVPERSTEPIDANGVALEMTFYVSDLGSEAFLVATLDLPPGSTFDLDMAVDAAAGEDGQVQRVTTTTWQGFDAIEAAMSDAAGMHVQMLIVLTPQRVYMVEVGSMNDPAAEFETFKASFEITL